jgi:carboxypeptidase D
MPFDNDNIDLEFTQQLPTISYNISDYLVTNLPGLKKDANITQYAGHIPVSSGGSGAIFFWLFLAPNTDQAPLVIWLNGGPGCSSMEGLFFENGPFVLDNSTGALTLKDNPYSWHLYANMLYVDQPIGTGLSYVTSNASYATNQTQVTVNFYEFLQTWLKIFQQFQGRDTYLTGESYAGIYIPYFVDYILTQQNASSNSNSGSVIPIALKGFAIGNGWIDPFYQMPAYASVPYFAGLINWQQEEYLNEQVTSCQSLLTANSLADLSVCDNVTTLVVNSSGTNTTGYVNVYDMRLYDPTAGALWPPAVFLMKEYLRSKEVKAAIHVNASVVWHDCNDAVYNALNTSGVSSLSLVFKYADRLRILLYSGQFDLTCPHTGTENFLNNFDWPQRTAFINATRYVWTVHSTTAGYAQQAGNVTYLLVLGAGHMVPYQAPAPSADMFWRFISNRSFVSSYAQFYAAPPLPVAGPFPTWAWVLIVIGAFLLGGVLTGLITWRTLSKSAPKYETVN